ncbi:MAG: dTMP kinase [Deltaproteobacteria bacterium]|nr:dTMP kinase [Deltaproteobacteria bacterium]
MDGVLHSPGLLVVLEGIDGSGKSTLAHALADALKARGFSDVVVTREPTDGPFGREIRAIAAGGRANVTKEYEYQLFQDDRRAHVEAVVRPALERGAVVVQDRSYFSTLVYQGERGLDPVAMRAESEQIAPKPDLLFIVDVPVEVALTRIRNTRTAADDFEREESLARVRRRFLGFEEAHIVDGTRPPEEVTRVVLDTILAARRGRTPASASASTLS